MLPKMNEMAPSFELPDDTGKIHKLSDYKGKTVVLYFYPEDGTDGCTTEACNFRDDYSAYQKAGITILGVSPDTVKSHQKFKSKYDLNFPFLRMKVIWSARSMEFGGSNITLARSIWEFYEQLS